MHYASLGLEIRIGGIKQHMKTQKKQKLILNIQQGCQMAPSLLFFGRVMNTNSFPRSLVREMEAPCFITLAIVSCLRFIDIIVIFFCLIILSHLESSSVKQPQL